MTARIEESDYLKALEELGWQVLEDFDRELFDVVPDAGALLYDFSQLGSSTSLAKLGAVIAQKITDSGLISTVVDVLIWTGCLGVQSRGTVFYISDCGFKRPFFRALITDPDDNCLLFHPTLAELFGSPGAAAISATRPKRPRGSDSRQVDLFSPS